MSMLGIIHEIINPRNLILLIGSALLSSLAALLIIYAGMRVILTIYPMPFFNVIVGCTIGGFIIGMITGSSIVLIRSRWVTRSDT